MREQIIQRPLKFKEVPVIQSAVALCAVPLQNIALPIYQHWNAQCHRLQHGNRQTFILGRQNQGNGIGKSAELVLFGNKAQWDNIRMLRNVANRFSHQHQLQIAWVTFLELDKIPEQGRAVFALINSTDINQIRGMNPVFLPECRGWRIIWNIYACSQHITRNPSSFELPPHEHPFFFCQENIRLRQLKQLFKCLKVQVWFFVGSRNENRFLCHFRQSGNRQIIQIRDK